MNITLPDPFPGRCLNHRMKERCLDYDGHRKMCIFPQPAASTWKTVSWSSNVTQPWKSPLYPQEDNE